MATQVKTLQTPNVMQTVITKATKRAKEDGLNSVHDVVRLLLKKYGDEEIHISISAQPEISAEREQLYLEEIARTEAEVKAGKRKIYYDVKEMMKDMENED